MSGRRPQPQLEWPAWLVERARQDDPPTQLASTSPLLVRLRRAGVDALVPVIGNRTADESLAATAPAIGATGPGLATAETLDDGPAPIAASLERLCSYLGRWDQLRRLRLAAADMKLVASVAWWIMDPNWYVRPWERALETAVVVIYARPYLDSSKGGVGQRWRPADPDDRELHDRIIDELRHPYHAHTDRGANRTLVDLSWVVGPDEPPYFEEHWSGLSHDELMRIAHLADRQHARLSAAADVIGEQLGEKRDPPGDGNIT